MPDLLCCHLEHFVSIPNLNPHSNKNPFSNDVVIEILQEVGFVDPAPSSPTLFRLLNSVKPKTNPVTEKIINSHLKKQKLNLD